MGVIPSTSNIPSAKFVSPANLDTVPPNTVINIQLAIQGMQTGFFVNPDTNYFAAPQQLNGQGQIQGHSHVVIEQLDSLSSTTPLNPTKFAFFKGLNEAAQNGILSTTVQGGLPAGVYRMASINTASNHQPLLVPVAQHGSLDDAVYVRLCSDVFRFFTCTDFVLSLRWPTTRAAMQAVVEIPVVTVVMAETVVRAKANAVCTTQGRVWASNKPYATPYATPYSLVVPTTGFGFLALTKKL